MDASMMLEDSEPQVTNISIKNLKYISRNRLLSYAESNFLMEIILLSEPWNRLKTTSFRDIAKKLNRSERRTRELMHSLLQKSILFEDEIKKGWFIHPEIAVVGEPDRVPLWLVEEVAKLQKRKGSPGWPLTLHPGKRRGVWRWIG